jgi:hypothetical protein
MLKRMHSKTDEDGSTLPPFTPPKGLQMSACGKFESLVAEFHLTRDGRNSRWNDEEHPVWKVLYEEGPHKVLQPRRPVDAGRMQLR